MIKAKLVELIYTEVTKGDGTKENPTRTVKQYWTLDGNYYLKKIQPILEILKNKKRKEHN